MGKNSIFQRRGTIKEQLQSNFLLTVVSYEHITKTHQLHSTKHKADEKMHKHLGDIYEPRREKTGLRGFRLGLTQIGL